jgi:hypothetical protein
VMISPRIVETNIETLALTWIYYSTLQQYDGIVLTLQVKNLYFL